MREIIILKGLPASGKSTWAKELIEKQPNRYKRINKDEIRAMLDNGVWSSKNEKYVLSVRDSLIERAINCGFDVIVDDTNLNPVHEERITQLASGLRRITQELYKSDIRVRVKDFTDVSPEECIKRNARRSNPVPVKAIRDMWEKYLKPTPPVIPYRPGLPAALIVDMDGTLSKNNGHRGFYEWDKVGEDKLKTPIAQIVDKFHDYEIIVLTGRDGSCADISKKWLKDNGINYNQFHIRPEGNTEKDAVIKKRIYEEHIKGKYNVLFVLDDRDQVVDMWRAEGLTCLQVDYGNF